MLLRREQWLWVCEGFDKYYSFEVVWTLGRKGWLGPVEGLSECKWEQFHKWLTDLSEQLPVYMRSLREEIW